MDKKQQMYAAFMEGVCDKLNCKDALPLLQKGFEAFCESTGVDCKYINLSDRPNFDVTLSHGGIDPHPLEITVQAYDESDAIDTVITKLAEHGIEGYAETDTPEHPEDYIEVSKGYVPVQNVAIKKTDTSRGEIRCAYVPEHLLSALVNADTSGLDERGLQELKDFEEKMAADGINAHGLNPEYGPDGEFWDVDEDFRNGNSVWCSEFVERK
jgi:hypothetical protein